jgi:hypothetical protein
VFDNTWHHISLDRNGTDFKLYVDGVLEHSDSSSVDINDAAITQVWEIMKRNATYAAGSIDDVRIYNRALSADDIAMLYNGGNGTEVDS